MNAFASLFGEVLDAAMDSDIEFVERPPTFTVSKEINGRPVRSWTREGEAGGANIGKGIHFSWGSNVQALGEPVDDLGR